MWNLFFIAVGSAQNIVSKKNRKKTFKCKVCLKIARVGRQTAG